VSDKIKPALTPREWAGRWAGPVHPGEGETTAYLDDDLLKVKTWRKPEIAIDDVYLHGVAALCLHEQPFGFTWEMYYAVDVLAKQLANEARADGGRQSLIAEAASEAAARIAALLSPLLPSAPR
jgi:hypothetical protein